MDEGEEIWVEADKPLKRINIKVKLLILVVLAALTFYLPGLANEALLWDDKAYINNALIASGRIRPEDAWGPYAEERPPLFWWLLTAIYLMGAPTWAARLLSPTFGLITVAAVYAFSSRIFGDEWAGFPPALLLALSSFFSSAAGDILTDVMGTCLAALYMFSLFLGFRKRPLLWLSGSLLALAVAARDQNLLLLPATLFFLLWAAELEVKKKLLVFFGFVVLASPAAFMGIEESMRLISETLTPVVIHPLFPPVLMLATGFTALLATYPREEMLEKEAVKLDRAVFDLGLAVFLGILFLYPYLIDNYRLGAEFQIAGRGILSRPIAHLIMARELGIGMELPVWERRLWWAKTAYQVLGAPLLILAAAGAFMLLRERRLEGKLLITWAGASSLYVILFTHLEARFIAQAFPPIFILAGHALRRLSRERPVSATILLILSALFLLFPGYPLPDLTRPPTFLQALERLLGLPPSRELWLTPYLEYLSNLPPSQPSINPLHPLLGLSAPILSVLSIYLALKERINSGEAG